MTRASYSSLPDGHTLHNGSHNPDACEGCKKERRAARSRSTSDTCSKCGKRIDICDKSNCPVAVSLRKTEGEAMQQLAKENRIQFLDEQITKLVDEYYSLVAPTEAEIEDATDLVWDCVKDEAATLLDPKSTIGKIYLGQYAEGQRADNAEAENA